MNKGREAKEPSHCLQNDKGLPAIKGKFIEGIGTF